MASTTLDHHRQVIRNRTLTAEWRRRIGAHLCRRQQLPEPLSPSVHSYKYRLFYGTPAEERVRYDNERGKGDHRHCRGKEEAYAFLTLDRLLGDFENDLRDWSTT